MTLSADKLLKLWIPHNVSLNPFTPMLNWRLHVFLTKTLVKTSWDTRKLAQRHTLRNKLIFYLLTLSLQECLVEFCKMTLTFESVGEILWCDHSNENSLAVLSHSAICSSKCYKMKFCKLGRHLPLATFGSERVKKAWVYVVVRAYFCCPPLPYAVLIVLKQNLNAERQHCTGGKGREKVPHFDEL